MSQFPPLEKLSGTSFAQMGSSLAGIMFILATLQQIFPNFGRDFFRQILDRILAFFRPEIQITFYEYRFSGYVFRPSDAYRAIEAYIGTLSMDPTNNATRLKADKPDKKSPTHTLVYSLEDYEEITDKFERVKFVWYSGKLHPNTQTISNGPWTSEKRYLRVSFKKKHRGLATNKYLNHVMETGETVLKKRRTRMLHTNNPSSDWDERGMWRKCVFEHSAKFENLAMDISKKNDIIQDLVTFSKAKDYYMKIGKAWKRGYLLYGPPGPGKTTMIACMANLLGFDVFDLELTTVQNNSELRNLLITTSGKSIILIEDIDCTLPVVANRNDSHDDGNDNGNDEEKKKKKKKTGSESDHNSDADKGGSKKVVNKSTVTLSGLLNIIDGLWSPCSEERIIVFTTNHIEKLDPALIRTGRMDRHIQMSYCTFEAFKVFVKNYLDIEGHPLFARIQELLSQVEIGPSDVAEILLPKSADEDPGRRLEAFIVAMEKKRKDVLRKLAVSEEIKPGDEKG
ncbi:hypothetical protein vseg_021135 [Gypsophila vaccaria]